MSNNSVQEVQTIASGILKEITGIFEKNNFRYVLCFGSLLGAIRHNGFIPWDDDLDIAMPREDFERFRAMANKLLPDYLFFQDYTTDSEYPSQIAKVRNSNTTMIENGYRNLKKMNHGIFVDIFVADYYTPSKKSNFRLKIVKAFRGILIAQKTCNTGKAKRTVARLFSRNALFKRSESLLKKLDTKEQKKSYIIDCTHTFDANMFDDTLFVKFEDIDVRVPREYHMVLTKLYGNYMELPPNDMRKPLHMTEHISTKIPFSRYIEENENL